MADLHFELVSPERLILSEAVTSVVVPGDDGEFEVFAGHAPFMTTLRPGVVTVKGGTDGGRKIFVHGGFADVNAAGFTLLAEEAIPTDEIDRGAIESAIRDAQEDVADAKTPAIRDEAERQLQHLKDVQSALGHG